MPMWIIHAPEGAYSTEDKKNLTEIITQFYVETVALPKFYVVVRFDEYLVNDFVRIVVDHIARQMDDPAIRELCMSMLCERLAPFTADRGLRSEIHLDETAMDLWWVNGIKPPPPESEAERNGPKITRPAPTSWPTPPRP